MMKWPSTYIKVFQSKIISGVGYDEMAVYINVKGSQSEAHLLLPPILADVALRVLTLIRSRLWRQSENNTEEWIKAAVALTQVEI